jgi:hypothetical protein
LVRETVPLWHYLTRALGQHLSNSPTTKTASKHLPVHPPLDVLLEFGSPCFLS